MINSRGLRAQYRLLPLQVISLCWLSVLPQVWRPMALKGNLRPRHHFTTDDKVKSSTSGGLNAWDKRSISMYGYATLALVS